MSAGEAWGRGPRSQEEAAKVAVAFAHPIRSRLLNLLKIRPGSGATELATWSGQSVSSVRRQLKRLVDDGLIDVQRQEARRGVSKRYYANTLDLVITEEMDDELSERLRLLLTLGTLRLLFEGATRGLSEGVLTARPDRVVGNTQGEVDEQGWRELAEFHRELLERVQKVMAASQVRLDVSGARPAARITSGVILVESSPLEDPADD